MKPTAVERRKLRADLYRAVQSLWGCTERQFYKVRVRKPEWPRAHYVDRQAENVLASIARIREACDAFEAAYSVTDLRDPTPSTERGKRVP